jgi:predicted transcriptional regulator
MALRRIDTLLALKAISLAPGLKENDRRVAAALVEHFNRETSQCDPGLKRIAGLLGISTRTVIRSTQRLENAGMFRKVRHGGHLNRNHYEPIWSRFRQIEVEWRARFRGAQPR